MRDWRIVILMVCLAGAWPVVGAERSPGESGKSSPPSPKPLTPQQRADLARAEFDAATQSMSQSGRRVAEAVRALNAAHLRYDEASEQARRELVKHPALVQAGRDVIEARAQVQDQRGKALRPLHATREFQELQRNLNRTNLRLDELRSDRRNADRKRLPFPGEQVLEIYKLAQKVLDLGDEVASAEASVLDAHKGYTDAVKAMEKAMAESAATMKDVVRLVRGGTTLQDSLKELQRCYSELAAANKAGHDARDRRDKAASSLGQALVSQ
ncbi:MAG: hypothetical protein WD768_14235 [Phycisphaeraceae bacterium]